MSAVCEVEVLDQPTTGNAIARYRQSVYAGQCDEEILFASRRLKHEWDADRRVYETRLAACEKLKNLPRLEAAAADVALAIRHVEEFVKGTIPDATTIGDLRANLAASGVKVPVNTPAEIARGLLHLSDPSPTGYLGAVKSKLVSARSAVSDTRQQARQTLIQTAADTGRDPQLASLGATIAEVEKRIKEREPILQAEAKAAAARAECEAIARGEVEPQSETPFAMTPVIEKSDRVRAFYQKARRRLDELLDLAARRPDAERDNAADQANLAALQAQVAETQQAALERSAVPENMHWCGDD